VFKYVSFTPITDEYTTHIFNEKNDKCTVHRFDVPYVSVSFEDESDFTELMAYQNPDIGASEITKEAFESLVLHSDQVNRMYAVVNDQYSKDLLVVSNKYCQEERDTWPAQTEEAHAVKDGTATETPYLTSLSEVEGISLEQAADKVLGNKAEYDEHSSAALTKKRDALSALKSEVGL